MKFVNFLISSISVLCWFPSSVWSLDYTILGVETTTTNENYIKSDLTMKFISRGCYGVSGYLYFNKEFLDDDVMAELTIGYNSQHYKTFAPTPFHAGPTDFLSFVNHYYKKYIMSSLANCSNAPQSDTDWETFEEFGKNFTFDKCILDAKDFPDTRSGYYSFTLNYTKNVSGDTPFSGGMKYIVQVENYF